MRREVAQLFAGGLVSKALGAAREVLNAALFGTGAVIGAYRVAQVGTLVPINFFTSDSLNAAFVPQYKSLQANDPNAAQTLFWLLAGLFSGAAIAIAAIIIIFARPWESIVAPGLGPQGDHLATEMLMIMGCGVPFYLLSALVMYLSLANGDFIPMAVRPTVQNCGLMGGAVMAFLLEHPLLFAWGFTVTYIAFLIWVTVRARNRKIMSLPTHWSCVSAYAVLNAFWRTLRPLVLLPLFLQGTIVIERAAASLVGLDAISGVDYARFISDSLIALIAMPVAFAGLAAWSGLSSDQARSKIVRVATLITVIAIALSAFLAVHAHLVVNVAYARGAFSVASAHVTAEILFGIAFGLWAQVLAYVLVKALNAGLRNRVVFLVMAPALAANAIFDLAAYRSLGALALGIGSSLYGIILVVGTLVALQICRPVIARTWWLTLAVVGYVVLTRLVHVSGSSLWQLAMCSVIALVYWGLWVLLVPWLRRGIATLIWSVRTTVS